MTTPNLETVKAKIAKLMALTESSNANEAASALAKARELMLEYQLSEGDVMYTTEKSRIEEVHVPNIQTPRQIWETELGAVVADAFNCRCLFNKFKLFFFGTKEDLEIATYTFEQLRLRIRDMAYYATGRHTEEFKREHGIDSMRGISGRDHPKVWRMAYVAGVVDGLRVKLAQMKKSDSSEVTALVVVRNTAVTTFINKTYPRTWSVELTMNSSNRGAYSQGYEDGRNMNVRPGVGAHRPDQLTD